MSTEGTVPREQCQGVNLASKPHLVQRLGNVGAITPFLHYVFMALTGP